MSTSAKQWRDVLESRRATNELLRKRRMASVEPAPERTVAAGVPAGSEDPEVEIEVDVKVTRRVSKG